MDGGCDDSEKLCVEENKVLLDQISERLCTKVNAPHPHPPSDYQPDDVIILIGGAPNNKKVFFGEISPQSVYPPTHPPTHPRVLVRFGSTKACSDLGVF